MADFGADWSWLILDATLIEIILSGYFGRKSDACAETMHGRKISDIVAPKTRLLFLVQVEPTKIQEGTYLQTPCKPESKATCVTYLLSLSNNSNSLQGLFFFII